MRSILIDSNAHIWRICEIVFWEEASERKKPGSNKPFEIKKFKERKKNLERRKRGENSAKMLGRNVEHEKVEEIE